MPNEATSQKNWFARHKILTGIMGVFAFFILIGALSGDGTEGIKAGDGTSQSDKDQAIVAQAGEVINLSTYTIKVLESREEKVISSGTFGTPKAAKEGTKFVIVEAIVTSNATSNTTFFPDDTLKLVDSQGRQFRTYDETIGSIDDYLDVATLSPGIPLTGVIVYEIPETETKYALVGVNKSNGDIYMVNLPTVVATP